MHGGFRHQALLHAGDAGFVAGAVPFLREGLAAGERVMAAVTPAKIGLLQAALGADAGCVTFADMTAVGVNPGRIIPAWRDFIDAAAGPVRGIGEPVWPGRSAQELVECHRHEELLNVAFEGVRGFALLCPYDTTAYDAALLERVRRCHPVLVEDGVPRSDHVEAAAGGQPAPFADLLPDPPAEVEQLEFGIDELPAARRLVWSFARGAGLRSPEDEDLVLAVNELTTNSVRHGGGRGTLRVWREGADVVCEVRDRGHIGDPLAGRYRPDRSRTGGYGLWLANQVCDLVQLRTAPDGSVARLHMRAR